MLDFYWIHDEEKPWEDPPTERLILSLPFEEWTAFDRVCPDLLPPFYEDQRWMSRDVLDACGLIREYPDVLMLKVKRALAAASERRSGIMTFCD